MKRPKRGQHSLCGSPHDNPWRWNIGGPITDFRDDGIEAGPSAPPGRRHHVDRPRVGGEDDISTYAPANAPRGRRRLALLATAALAVQAASAGPVPVPPLTSCTQPPAPTQTLGPRRILTEPEYLPPTAPPSEAPTAVPETALPLYLTKGADGNWYKVDNAWSLYGRVASPASGSPTPVDQYLISQSVPTGWGRKNARSSTFYNTPMIATASVILGLIIVFAIVIITYQRRKSQRRDRRHAARMRRKALAAAGLTEDALQDANSTAGREFKEKLAELERAHAVKRRAQRAQFSRSAYVRTKVRVWRGSMRRRKNAKPQDDDGSDLKAVTSTPNGYSSSHVLQRQRSPEESLLTRDSVSLASTVESNPRDQIRRRIPPFSRGTDDERDNPPGDMDVVAGEDGATTDTAVNDTSLPPSSDEEQSPSSPPTSQPPLEQRNDSAGHMPPAYRPASVRSLQVGSSSGAVAAPPTVLSPEKAVAAGFYPAPATEDAEVAQSVARRADSKAPINIPVDNFEEHRRHVATDDKRELERLRLGASAPPVASTEESDSGPSAPTFAVDEAGWEVSEERSDAEPSDPPPESALSGFSAAGVPLPPRPRALRTFTATSVTDEAHLLPSAPPGASPSPPSAPQGFTASPSAPPLDAEHTIVPSAPPLDLDFAPSVPALDDDYGTELQRRSRSDTAGTATTASTLHESDSHGSNGFDAASHDSAHSHTPETEAATDTRPLEADAGDVRASLNVGGHGFLPRYEP